jgi:S-methylmethionine-dependent homocysteine/selenocysteine methylase
VQAAKQWLANDAQIIGGCCGTTPEYIKDLHQLLDLSF